jgi:glyoxylase-like metal-dependent hydrolase (beta-lactamase superfamily II)
MSKAFASQGDLAEKRETFAELAPSVFALTAEGDPNSGVVIGDDSVLVIDARATPVMAKELVAHIRKVTDKPIRHVLLTHYHAVRVLGVAGYEERVNVIASDVARGMIMERGQQDMESEIQRFPRLFRAKETIPGLTWPNIVFHQSMTLWLGSREVQIIHAGRGHTKGDTIAWLPQEKVLFAGDLVEFGATPYCGDAHFGDWPGTLDRLAALSPRALVPGRGEALATPDQVGQGITETRAFLEDLFGIAKAGVAAGHSLKQVYATALERLRPKYGHWVIFDHCMPFDVSRAYDEAQGIDNPRIWTAERDVEMWRALESAVP